MDLIPWMPIIVEITKFTLDQLGKLVDSDLTSAKKTISNVRKIKISSQELTTADFPQLALKINRLVTLDSIKRIEHNYQLAKNIKRQIEIKETALTCLMDQASLNAQQLQFELKRLQEDQFYPLINELNESLGQIYLDTTI
jgi:hypothetical protein